MRSLWADPACAKLAGGELAAPGRVAEQSLGALPLPRDRPEAGAAAGAAPGSARVHDPPPSGTAAAQVGACAAGLQEDLELVQEAGGGRVAITVGSALDIFGGNLAFDAVLKWHRGLQQADT